MKVEKIFSYTLARLHIEALLAENLNIDYVKVKLKKDWDSNNCIIYKNGEYFPYTDCEGPFLSTPKIIVYFKDGNKLELNCFCLVDKTEALI